MAEPAKSTPFTYYTWNDYRALSDETRRELLGGELFDMSPSPSVRHQMVSLKLEQELSAYLKGKKCQLFHAPLDLKLSEDDVLQPDIFLVCDKRQIHATHVEGAPSLVVEVTSPGSLSHDRVRKFTLYERAGIPEYWIVTPYPSLIEVFRLEGGRYHLAAGFERNETLLSPGFPGLEIALDPVFDFPLEPGEELPRVRERPNLPRAKP